MMNKIIFLLIIQLCLPTTIFSQQEELNERETESLELEFTEYLTFLFNQSNDSKIDLDTAAVYKIKFKTTLSYDIHYNRFDSCYADTHEFICVCNAQHRPHSIQLNSFDIEPIQTNNTHLKNDPKKALSSSTHLKNPFEIQYDLQQGTYVTLLSFEKGKYIIMYENFSEPDMRSSMPPGYDVTYFLERID